MPWAQTTPSAQDEFAVLEAGEASFDADVDWGYTLVEAPTGQLVGGAGLHRREGLGVMEIGYWVRSDRTGRGYASAAARALTEAAFRYLPDVNQVEIHMDVANDASAAVPRKLGYLLDREEERERFTPGHTGRGLVWIVTRTT
jgi:RimJ/RimL family protein N-acetyltransferase